VRAAPRVEVPIASRVGLPDDLVPAWRDEPAEAPGAPRRVLVTGATGYLGAHLVAELLRQTSAEIVCLVRGDGPDEARRRLAAALERHDSPGAPAGWAERVKALAGDFTRPRFGLEGAEYEALAGDVDAVVHCGAWVNFIYPYAVLERANVGGLEEVLRFAACGRRKVVHHLSSTAVLFAAGYERDRRYPEQHPLASDGELPNGYEQTKWVADKNVEIARARGFLVSNYRVGYVTGASDDGRDFRLGEFFPAMLKGCVQLGVAPRLDTTMTMVPIDYAAAAIVRILAQPASWGLTFHLNHPAPVHFDDVVRWLREYGYPLATEDFDAWRERVAAVGDDNALRPYLGFVRNLKEKHVWLPPVDVSDTLAFAAPLGCPPTPELLATYFALFHRAGFLAPPPSRAASASAR
jgi:phthiocerol/phenolphthiocerol synthesis type-I polyketide synthase E